VPALNHTPFQMYGGKWEMAPWIVEHLPRGQTLVLTHGGSGSPLWHIEPPYPVEVYNDLDGGLVNFFRVCRDEPEALATLLLLTPYHRHEWRRARDDEPTGDQLENARRFATVARQSMAGAWGRAWSSVITHSRRGMASGNSRWLRLPETVLEIAARFSSVQIECMDACALVRRYDRPGTVFYLDPPYHPNTRQPNVYHHEYTHEDHVVLLDALDGIKGRAVLSGYDCELYQERLRNWKRVEREVPCRSAVKNNGEVAARTTRKEVLWIK